MILGLKYDLYESCSVLTSYSYANPYQNFDYRLLFFKSPNLFVFNLGFIDFYAPQL